MKSQKAKKKKPCKKTKPKQKTWKLYVEFLVNKNKGKPLKELLQNYSKSDYKKFQKNPCVHI